MGRFSIGLPIGALCLCLVPAWVGASEPKSAGSQPELEIRIVFDNTSARADMQRSWGFSAVIDFGGHRILFDAGSDPILLLEHLEKLDIPPTTIEHAVISHQHGDHLRGVYWVFEENPKLIVHFLDCFPEEAFRNAAGVKMEPRRITTPVEIVPGIHSTGVVDGLPPEQSLAIETSQGLVMLVGCSHPGLIKLVETAEKQREKDSIRLLLGGFHMLRQDAKQIDTTISRLKELKVKTVLPAHCSGDLAKELFKLKYGEDFQAAGVGRRIVLENGQFVVSTIPAKPVEESE